MPSWTIFSTFNPVSESIVLHDVMIAHRVYDAYLSSFFCMLKCKYIHSIANISHVFLLSHLNTPRFYCCFSNFVYKNKIAFSLVPCTFSLSCLSLTTTEWHTVSENIRYLAISHHHSVKAGQTHWYSKGNPNFNLVWVFP